MGSTVYSNDRRIQVAHPNRTQSDRNNNRDDWLLNIRSAQPADSGVYECQINTEPKKSKAYILKVVGKEWNSTEYILKRGIAWHWRRG